MEPKRNNTQSARKSRTGASKLQPGKEPISVLQFVALHKMLWPAVAIGPDSVAYAQLLRIYNMFAVLMPTRFKQLALWNDPKAQIQIVANSAAVRERLGVESVLAGILDYRVGEGPVPQDAVQRVPEPPQGPILPPNYVPPGSNGVSQAEPQNMPANFVRPQASSGNRVGLDGALVAEAIMVDTPVPAVQP